MFSWADARGIPPLENPLCFANGFSALLFLALQRSAVTGPLHRSDNLVGVCLTLLDLHDGLVWIGDFRADHPRDFFECRPHSHWTVNWSGHARDDKIDGLLLLLHLSFQGTTSLRVGNGSAALDCCNHRRNND